MLNLGLGMMSDVLHGVAVDPMRPTALQRPDYQLNGRRGSLRGMRGLGALTEYPSVGVLQFTMNMERLVAKQDVANGVTSGPTKRFASSTALVQDNKYGRHTHGALKLWVDWRVDRGDVSGISSSDVQYAGPQAAADMLTEFLGIVAPQTEEIQEAWREWRAAGQPAVRQGDVDEQQRFLNQPPAEKKGMPWWGWGLIALGVGAGGYAIYRWSQD